MKITTEEFISLDLQNTANLTSSKVIWGWIKEDKRTLIATEYHDFYLKRNIVMSELNKNYKLIKFLDPPWFESEPAFKSIDRAITKINNYLTSTT